MNNIEYINDEKNSNKNSKIEIIRETEREGDTTDIIEDNLKKEKLIYDYDNNKNEEDKIFKSLSFISKLKIILLNGQKSQVIKIVIHLLNIFIKNYQIKY